MKAIGTTGPRPATDPAALVAFDATPRVLRAVSDILAGLPARLADRYLPKGD